MQREIKFRAWAESTKQMSEPFSLLQALSRECVETPHWNDAKFMQFTILKDKNGKEIYEGDIVFIPDTYKVSITDEGEGPTEDCNHLSQVAFTEGQFVFIIRENADCLDRGIYNYGEIADSVGIEELEIIGNIYENPELLK